MSAVESTHDRARRLMYEWHDGAGSALYAAASSGPSRTNKSRTRAFS